MLNVSKKIELFNFYLNLLELYISLPCIPYKRWAVVFFEMVLTLLFQNCRSFIEDDRVKNPKRYQPIFYTGKKLLNRLNSYCDFILNDEKPDMIFKKEIQ